jgi:hypothetical protein
MITDNQVNQLLTEVQSDYKDMLQESRPIIQRWDNTGLLEGLNSNRDKGIVSRMLEEQSKQLIKEASRTGTSEGNEEWSGIALPLVRRIFDNVSAKEFVSVQPMNLPSGLVFYIDYKYGTDQPGFVTGSGNESQEDSVYGVTKTSGDPHGGLYGSGRFGYTLNDYNSSELSLAGSLTDSTYTTASAISPSDYNYDSSFSASLASQLEGDGVAKVTVSGSALPDFDPFGIRAFEITGTGIDKYYPAFTTIDNNHTEITFIVSGSGVYGDDVTIKYHKQPTPTSRGDFEAKKDSILDIPEINLEFSQKQITAKTRKLKASWTPEFTQDIQAYQNIDAEAELTSMMAEYVSQDIDLELLDMLINAGVTEEYWSAELGKVYDGSSNTFVTMSSSTAAAYQQGTWFQTLGTKLQKVSNKIHQKTMRGGANFMVVSPDVSTIIESIPGFSADTSGDQSMYSFGVTRVGAINNRYTVYKNPYMLENVILMGFKGNQFLETGAVYAPYIPLIMTPTVYDKDNFTPRRGLMTRYAKEVVRPEYFGRVYVHGLNTI